MLAVLLVASLAPAACVLWFMNAAMTNERLAVREKLTQAYTGRLVEAQRQIDDYWNRRAGDLSMLPGEGPGEAFARLAKSGKGDSFIVLDETGRIAYPNASSSPPQTPTTASEPSSQNASRHDEDLLNGLLAQAEEAEFALASPAQAAEVYGRIAAEGADARMAARALLAQARCLAKADRREEAISLLIGKIEQPRFAHVVDVQGRLLIAGARMLAVELMSKDDPRVPAAIERLVDQVDDYRDLSMPASQRMFLMARLSELLPDAALPTLQAEMSCQTLGGWLLDYEKSPGLITSMATVWGAGYGRPPTSAMRSAMMSEDRRVFGLLRTERVIEETEQLINRGPGAVEVTCRVIHPAANQPEQGTPFLQMPASNVQLSDWRVSLYLNGPDPFAEAAKRQNDIYLWTGAGGIVFIVVLAVAMVSYLGRQLRLTRLKNDLIATVSHELKTPLASMRVLVDTLREGRCTDAGQAREYFELIARENERLSRLIDNFLTFSRMERNKRAFEFAPIDVAEAARTAAAAVAERFSRPDCRLEVDAPDGLPRVLADRDAMVTVLLNLLDNAWKYSPDEKRLALRAFAADGAVVVEVSDNGVGMSRRAQRRIFNKFYQVDQTLSRKAGGCGLGLAIVKFILDAHGGTISVKSQSGKGSTFTVRLRAVDATAPDQATG